MSRTVFYCRCGARLAGASERLNHRCEKPHITRDETVSERDCPHRPDATGEYCQWCGRRLAEGDAR